MRVSGYAALDGHQIRLPCHLPVLSHNIDLFVQFHAHKASFLLGSIEDDLVILLALHQSDCLSSYKVNLRIVRISMSKSSQVVEAKVLRICW